MASDPFRERGRIGWLLLIIILMTAGYLVYRNRLGPFSGIAGSPQIVFTAERVQKLKIEAAIHPRERFIVIRNGNDFTWRNLEMELNPGKTFRGFAFRIDQLGPGKDITINDLSFASERNERFDLTSHRLIRLQLVCDTASGKGYFIGSLKNPK
jgi:hypothetical protein